MAHAFNNISIHTCMKNVMFFGMNESVIALEAK